MEGIWRRYCTSCCGGGKSSPFQNEVIFPASPDLSLGPTGEQSLCGLSPTIIMQEGERGGRSRWGWIVAGLSTEEERQILWDSSRQDFIQTDTSQCLGKGSMN